MKPRLLAICCILFAITSESSAQIFLEWPPNCSIAPEQPTTLTPVTITLSGLWHNSCAPRNPHITIVGNTIYFDSSTGGPICLQVIVNWSLSQTVGPLPAGHYFVIARLNSRTGYSPEYPLIFPPDYPPANVCDFEVIQRSQMLPVNNFTATPGARKIILSWTNPTDFFFTGTMIRVSTTDYPATPTDGTLLIDKPNTPGSNDSTVHSNLPNERYYYSAFAHDEIPSFSVPATVSAVPISANDFDGDGDVDQEDFGRFQACLTDGEVPCPPECRPGDFNDDGTVDQQDLRPFLDCMGGPDQPPGC